MRMYTIEIDEQVYAFLRNRVADFNEKANDVLRRELPLEGRPGRRTQPTALTLLPQGNGLPVLPFGTPAKLEQTLQVAVLVRNRRLPRSVATQTVATAHRVAPQTVLDKYTRQLGLKSAEFDDWLAEPGLQKLRNRLRKDFPGQHQLIDELLDSCDLERPKRA